MKIMKLAAIVVALVTTTSLSAKADCEPSLSGWWQPYLGNDWKVAKEWSWPKDGSDEVAGQIPLPTPDSRRKARAEDAESLRPPPEHPNGLPSEMFVDPPKPKAVADPPKSNHE